MVTKRSFGHTSLAISSVLAKILMVTKHAHLAQFFRFRSVLAKILMVTKQTVKAETSI